MARLRRPYAQSTRDQCTRQGAPPWRVPARIAYASSRMQPSPVSSSSQPLFFLRVCCATFPSRPPFLSLSSVPAVSFSPLRLIFCSDFSPSSTTTCTRCSPYSFLTYPAHPSPALLLSLSLSFSFFFYLSLLFAHSPPSQRPFSSLFALLHLQRQSPTLRIIPAGVYRTIYIYVCE